MLKKLHFLVLLFGITMVPPCWAFAPTLISKPDYNDGITSHRPTEKIFYFITLDGYPVIRTPNVEWFYVINPDPRLVLEPLFLSSQSGLLTPSHSYYSILK